MQDDIYGEYLGGENSESESGFDRSWLERLLSRNRNIEVVDAFGQRYTDGPNIDKGYALNYFYNGSARTVRESTSLRPLLVATVLAESASENFQYTALLLSHHTDVLCEFFQDTNLEDTVSSASIPQGACQAHLSKRKAPTQPARAAKKGARDGS